MSDITERLDAIRARAEAATPGLVLDAQTMHDWHRVGEVDVRRIAQSAADVPALLAFAREVLKFADDLIEQGDEHVTGCQGQADCAACVNHDLRAIAARTLGGEGQ